LLESEAEVHDENPEDRIVESRVEKNAEGDEKRQVSAE
jgi:hypothetical protein